MASRLKILDLGSLMDDGAAIQNMGNLYGNKERIHGQYCVKDMVPKISIRGQPGPLPHNN